MREVSRSCRRLFGWEGQDAIKCITLYGVTTRRRTSADYADMADDYAAHPPTIDEITSVEVNPAVLRKGRPAKGMPGAGKTPALPIRLPESIRAEIEHRVQAGESGSASELIRQAIVEYFDNHPVASH